MSEPYEEWVEGEMFLRLAPGTRHEAICTLLHARVAAALQRLNTTRLMPRRSAIKLCPENIIRPDLALVTAATQKLWLAAEIVNSDDHRPDTVTKKSMYEQSKVPRLWMIDPRYDNIEVYHATPYGLMLKGILAGREILTENLLPGFELTVRELFAPEQ